MLATGVSVTVQFGGAPEITIFEIGNMAAFDDVALTNDELHASTVSGSVILIEKT